MKFLTSWDKVADWYDSSVGAKGHYYHKNVIFPHLLKLLSLPKKEGILLDLACGQGALARVLPKNIQYVGVDISKKLIAKAKNYPPSAKSSFYSHDLTKPFSLRENNFDFASCILALQNIAEPLVALKNCASHLKKNGRLALVINHPCFRIPRQSSWEVDEKKGWLFRRIDRYGTSMSIPITTHPSKKESSQTLSFHHPLSTYSLWLQKSGFVIEKIEEWYSDKESSGKKAKMENRSRKEFPLFLAFLAKKEG